MYEVLFISLASLATLYTSQPILVTVVSSILVQYYSSRVASESALYMVSSVVSTQMPIHPKPGLLHLEMYLLLGLGFALHYFAVNQWIAVLIVELSLNVFGTVEINIYQRGSFLALCAFTSIVWSHDVTFYTTLTMVGFCAFLLAKKSQQG